MLLVLDEAVDMEELVEFVDMGRGGNITWPPDEIAYWAVWGWTGSILCERELTDAGGLILFASLLRLLLLLRSTRRRT